MFDYVQYQIGTLPAGSLNFGGWSQHLPAAKGTSPAEMPDAVVKYKKQLEANKTTNDPPPRPQQSQQKNQLRLCLETVATGWRRRSQKAKTSTTWSTSRARRSWNWTAPSHGPSMRLRRLRSRSKLCGRASLTIQATRKISSKLGTALRKQSIGADGFAGARKCGPGLLWAVCVGCVFKALGAI